ncbi:Uncharacterised protein [Escherichia coli]|nr:Uncharacterised protein [Escherichia coli]
MALMYVLKKNEMIYWIKKEIPFLSQEIDGL